MKTSFQTLLSCTLCFCVIQNIPAQLPALIKDINPGSSHSNPLYLTTFQNGVFFIADDGVNGQESWISNGTEAGTFMLTEMYPGNDEPFYSRNPLVAGNLIYFIGNDGINGGELWVSDGTSNGTKMLRDLYPGKSSSMLTLSFMVEMGGLVYFAPREGGGGIPNTRGSELWKTDGTAEGTVIVKDIVPGGNSSLVNHLVATDDLIYFAAQNNEFGNELWVSDGTEEGTLMLSDINEGNSFSNPEELTVAGNFIYFFANDGIHGRELWRTDGTGDGTILVKDINPGEGDSHGDYIMGSSAGTVFFNADDGVTGDELWVSSGPESTSLIEINPGEGDSGPRFFTEANGKVFFSATENEFGRELWMSDGTVAGTKLAANINEGSSGSYPDNFVGSDGAVYLSSNQGIWRSDGTEAGTYGITNREQGVDANRELAINNGVIYFNGNGFDFEGEILGYELFKITDGTSTSRSSERGKPAEITMYPNPANNLLTIETGEPEHCSIKIRTLNGQLMFKAKMEGPLFHIALSSFPKGVYFVTVRSKDRVITRKIIKL